MCILFHLSLTKWTVSLSSYFINESSLVQEVVGLLHPFHRREVDGDRVCSLSSPPRAWPLATRPLGGLLLKRRAGFPQSLLPTLTGNSNSHKNFRESERQRHLWRFACSPNGQAVPPFSLLGVGASHSVSPASVVLLHSSGPYCRVDLGRQVRCLPWSKLLNENHTYHAA